jgi:hypothetical protein
MAKTTKGTPAPVPGKRTRIVDHSAKASFWKPKYEGEHLIGKLARIAVGAEGRKSLKIMTQDGTKSVGVNFALVDVDWEKYVGKVLDLTFTGEVGTRHGRSYDVDVIESDDASF